MLADLFQARDELRKTRGLGNESIRAEVISPLDFRAVKGSSEHDDRQAHPFLAPAYPGENIKAVHPGHIEIKQEQVWDGKTFAIGIGFIALEILQNLLSIRNDVNGIFKPAFLEGRPNEKNVVRAVVCQ